jgi:hypothetical protein
MGKKSSANNDTYFMTWHTCGSGLYKQAPAKRTSIKKPLVSTYIYTHIYTFQERRLTNPHGDELQEDSGLPRWWLSSPQLRRRAGPVSSWSRKLKLDALELMPVWIACAWTSAPRILHVSGFNIRIPGEGELMIININSPGWPRAWLRFRLTPPGKIPSHPTPRAQAPTRLNLEVQAPSRPTLEGMGSILPDPLRGDSALPDPRKRIQPWRELRPPAGARTISNHHGCGGVGPGPCSWCQEGSRHVSTWPMVTTGHTWEPMSPTELGRPTEGRLLTTPYYCAFVRFWTGAICSWWFYFEKGKSFSLVWEVSYLT